MPAPNAGSPVLHVLFIHSAGAQDNDESSRPLLRGLKAALPPEVVLSAPIMPAPDDPDAARWRDGLRENLAAVEDELVLVGHSLGGSTILQYLATQDTPPRLRGAVTLAAPFWGMPGWEFADFALPPDLTRLKGIPITLYGSTEDDVVEIDHLDRYAALLPHAVVRQVSGTGHLFDRVPFARIAVDIQRLGSGGPVDAQ